MRISERHDWVVIGSGSAGGVIAARASERPDLSVLLLEAGADYPTAIPKDLLRGGRNSYFRHDWRYYHVPTEGQWIPWVFPRGKVVGGSSSVNTCIAIRGRPYDYDEWGLSEWTFEKCLPAFKRFENDLDVHDEWHGQDGPIRIRRHTREELLPWQDAFVESCILHGFPRCPDHNNPTLWGAGPHAMNKIGGERQSVLTCYFTHEVRKRDNLTIAASTLVRRVLFERRKVTGVEVEQEGVVRVIPAKRVMLSAGAINTPGVLLRSGIGPRETVERLGVELIMDLPAVGARLLDHPGAAIFFLPTKAILGWDDPLIQTACRYTAEGSPYPVDTQLQAGGIVPFPRFTVPLVTMMCQVGKPRGHGTLRYDSADPHAKPHIESHILEDEHDRAQAIEALRVAYAIAQEAPCREMATLLWPRPKTLMSERAHEWIRNACDSGYHPCGTVPMGEEGDEGAAVDQHGRVRGVEGLFVADASIFPTVPSANTNLSVLMVGERFGEWVKAGEI